MPPKKQKKQLQNYDWVSSVPDASQITARHRRAAAGLAGQLQCSFPYSSLSTPGPSTNSDSGSDIVVTKDTGCSAAKCRRNPRCYNHIGVAEVMKAKRDEWMDDQLGDPPVMREDDRPAGLRNLGATCYANAFLQVWYRNIVFRNGVYKAAQTAKPNTPIYHLAIVFASLQFSERAAVDPSPLIDSLGLKKGDQQDAAEFSKLFISLINDAFARSPDPSVRNTVNDLFQGKIENVNTCLRCKTASHSQQPLLELDLPLKKRSNTVEECLADMHSVERLTGDNQYHCSVCGSKQDAERTTFLREVPPYLNLCLMRFTYEKNRRVKSKAAIRYKKELKVGDQRYKLCAVVVHVGTSAHHGHFKCDVWDEDLGSWIVCNDEVIEKPDRAKRRKPDPDLPDDDYISCSQAYMLVYRLERDEKAMPPSETIMDKVLEDSAKIRRQLIERKRQEEIAGDNWGHLQGAKMDVIRHLPGTDRIVPTAQLRTWLAAKNVEDLWIPWDFSAVQCEHGGIDPAKGGDCTLISEQAFERIHIDPSTDLPDLEVCPVCVEAEYERLKSSGSLAESVRTFDSLNEDRDADYVLSREWVQAWRKGEVGAVRPTDPPYSIICEHGSRWDNGVKTAAVSGQAIALLRSIVGDFKVFKADEPMCGECAEASAGDRAVREEAITRGRVEFKMYNRSIQPNAPNPPFGVSYLLLPRGWSKAWRATVKNGVPCPTPWNVGICEHGGLNWDPAIEGPEWADEDAFDAMCQRYGPQPKVELSFGPNKLPGKLYNVTHLDPGVCETCRKQRLSTFDTAWICIKFGRPGDRQVVMDRRGGTRTRGGKAGYQLEVKRDMTVKDIKLDILHAKQLSPIYQLLRYNGVELTDPAKTMQALGVVEHDEIWCEILEDQDDFEVLDGRPAEEGFGGTALVGNIECPQCTLLNQASALACDACGMEFAFE